MFSTCIMVAMKGIRHHGSGLVSVWSFQFSPTIQKCSVRLIDCSRLPLGVNKCVSVCVWCPVIDLGPIQSVLPPHVFSPAFPG